MTVPVLAELFQKRKNIDDKIFFRIIDSVMLFNGKEWVKPVIKNEPTILGRNGDSESSG